MSKKRDEQNHRMAVEAANDLIRKLKMNGDDKQYAAGLALTTWRNLTLTIAKEKGADRDVIGAALAWALKYNETYWSEVDKR